MMHHPRGYSKIQDGKYPESAIRSAEPRGKADDRTLEKGNSLAF
jgi:hypothetical protein